MKIKTAIVALLVGTTLIGCGDQEVGNVGIRSVAQAATEGGDIQDRKAPYPHPKRNVACEVEVYNLCGALPHPQLRACVNSRVDELSEGCQSAHFERERYTPPQF